MSQPNEKRYKVLWKAPSMFQPRREIEAEYEFDEEDAKVFAWSILKQGHTVRVEEVQGDD